ncbi:MAG: RagB/SusD family nutrient uptake outer membrane protein [Ferruginibacter sp.]|nr:RagB/SusD family nutrient uptake outer membrane protein [Cytophagales bacterium]
MKRSVKNTVLLLALTFGNGGCSFFNVDDTVDPNSPAVESVLTNASRAQLNQLGIGVQSATRNGLSNYYLVSGSIGREVYNLASTELTWTTELLGSMSGGLSPTTLFNGHYADFSQTRRRAEIFLRSAEQSNATAPDALTEAQKQGIRGFSNTVKAFVMLNTLNMQYQNGIRLTFSDLATPGDLLKPGPFGTYEASLAAIKGLLDEGAAQLSTAGDDFAFPVSVGYAGFNKPATYRKFNRAVAARVAMYQQDWVGMLSVLDESFLDRNGPLTTGPVYTFSTTAGDLVNPLFQALNTTNSPVVAQNAFVSDAEPGDTRVARKVTRRTTPRTFNGLNGVYDASLYATNTDPVSILRNEELILMYAEAKIQTGQLAEAVTVLNRVRTSAGLQPLAIAKPAVIGNKDALIDELLNQRRYSLWYEGHRWFDVRRYNRLDQLPNDAPNQRVYDQLIRPFAEVQWDAKNPQ